MRLKNLFLIGWMGVLMTSCYSMPSDYDYSVVPSTNNPDFTGGRTAPAMPQMPQMPGGGF